MGILLGNRRRRFLEKGLSFTVMGIAMRENFTTGRAMEVGFMSILRMGGMKGIGLMGDMMDMESRAG